MASCDRHSPDYHCDGKHEWPELVGVATLEAKDAIVRENTTVKLILIMRYPDIAPSDFCCNRARLWADNLPNGKVLFTPVIA